MKMGLIGIVLMSFMMISCADIYEPNELTRTLDVIPNTEDSGTVQKKEFVDISVKINLIQGMNRNARSFSDVTNVKVSVKDGSTFRIENQAFTKNNNVWEGTLAQIPVLKELTFITSATDASGNELFNSSTNYTLQSESSSISLSLKMSNDGDTYKLPKIEQISRPTTIPAGTTKPVNFYVSGTFNETLTWTIESQTGTFSSTTGTITLEGTLGLVSLQFQSPETIGAFQHSIRVVNSDGNAIKAMFDTSIVDTWKTIQSSIFGTCVSCHNNTTDASGNGLSFALDRYTTLVNNRQISSRALPYIDSRKSKNSYVIQKLQGSGSLYTGARMPKNGPYLSAAQITRLTDWINAGAIDVNGDAAAPNNYPVGSWMYVQSKVFQICTACHTDNAIFPVANPVDGGFFNSKPKGISFDPDKYFSVVNDSTVRPYEPNNSKAWTRVIETDVDKRMPYGMPALSAEQKQIMKDWINAGAKKK
ncbi:MAG: hypothetical protein HQM12_17705 [SAR324 cluster bacterium]|nr:hypothetical protein [SAR324 cluster bacterium]MBF0350490.1 hypothetical protein [SAR324 cluster bacterium]